MRIDKHILSAGLLTLALVYTLWFVFAGFGNHQDPCYWLYKYQSLEGGWLAAGTLLSGGLVLRLFGAQLLPLRIAGWLCTVTAVALPYCLLQSREQRRDNLHWLALAYMLMGYGAFQELSPGTLSVLVLSALWVCAIKQDESGGAWSVLSAVLAGLAVTVRFPNILVLLVLVPLWKKRSLWLVPVAAVTAGLVYLLGWLFISPAPVDPAMGSHDLGSMLTKLWENGGKLAGYLLMAVGVMACRQRKYAAYVVGALLVYVIVYTIRPLQWYNMDLTYLVSALCLVTAFKWPVTSYRLPIGAAILLIATLGTDTGWLKLFPAVLCLLPVAAVYYDEAERRYLWIVLAIMSLMVAKRMTTNSVGQSNLLQVETCSTVAPYRHIFIREAEEQRLLRYRADYDSLSAQGGAVMSIGQDMHLIRSVTGCEAAAYNEFWSNIFDSVYTDKYREVIRAEHPVVFCSFAPHFKIKPAYKDKESCLENMLREEGYREIDRSKYKYMIYIPTTNDQ